MALSQWLDRIHQGDCLELMRQIPSRSVGLIVTSPPFNLGNSTGNGDRPRYDSWDDSMPHADYVAWQRECLTEMLRIVKPDGAIFYNHKLRVQDGLEQDRSDILDGFPLRQTITWERDGGQNHNPGYFLPKDERIYLIVPSRRDFELTAEFRGLGTVWHVRQDTKNKYPGSFPVEIPYRCIAGASAEVVLDPFMGSGTTALAAIKARRRYVGLEISEYACNLARRRIAAAGKGGLQQVLDFLAGRTRATLIEIIEGTGLSKKTIMRAMEAFRENGVIAVTPDPIDRRRSIYKVVPAGTRPSLNQSVSENTTRERAGYPRAEADYIAGQHAESQIPTQIRCHADEISAPGDTYFPQIRCHADEISAPGDTYLPQIRCHADEISAPGDTYLLENAGHADEHSGVSEPRERVKIAAVASKSYKTDRSLATPEAECPLHGAAYVTVTTLREVEAMDAAIGSVTYYCAFASRCSWRWNSHPEIGEYHPAGVAQPDVKGDIALRAAAQPFGAGPGAPKPSLEGNERGGYLESYRRRYGRLPWETADEAFEQEKTA